MAPRLHGLVQAPLATAQETRDAFVEVISKDEYKDLREIMDEANPQDHRESLDKFISLVHKISKSLFILIVKMHQAIVLRPALSLYKALTMNFFWEFQTKIWF